MPLPDFTLRRATAADLPAIVEIYNATIASRMVTADLEPVTVESRRPWFAAHQPASHPIWVFCDAAGAVCAWLSFDAFYPRAAYDGTAMIALYVGPAHRRLGIGRHLLQAAIAGAPGLGFHTLLGYIFGHNEPSLRLFASHGFIRWGHLPRVAVLDGVERDLIIVGLRVRPRHLSANCPAKSARKLIGKVTLWVTLPFEGFALGGKHNPRENSEAK